MNRHAGLRLPAVTALVVSAVCTAHAAPSGLNIIPTADVLEAGQASLEMQSSGVNLPIGDEFDDYTETEYGYGGNFEFGIDSSLRGSGRWLNAKWRLMGETKKHPALAVGIQNVGTGSDDQAYVAGCKSFGSPRLHAGGIVVSHHAQAMLGFECPIAKDSDFQADYTTGTANFLSMGVEADLSKRVTLALAWLHGNCSDTGDGYSLTLGWCGKF